MIGIEFTFPTRRYHATPWNRQVNEGEVEWPPSPWRLYRALVATWHRKVAGADDEPDELAKLVETLSTTPPVYELPDASSAHTRHYMPLYRTDRGKTTKIFDAFVHVEEGGALRVGWPDTTLAENQRRLLELLCERLGYLGRAESWVQARVMSQPAAADIEPNCVPLSDAQAEGAAAGRSEALVETLAPIDPSDYEEWRDEQAERFAERRRRYRLSRGWSEELSDNDRQKIRDAVPETFFGAVCYDTERLADYGWNRPPGSRWIKYRRPELTTRPGVAMPARQNERTPTVARFKLHADVQPLLTDAVAVGDAFRKALMSKADDDPRPPQVFSGKDGDGQPLEGHVHNHVIIEALDGDGRASHVTLWAPMGFDPEARRTLERVHKIWNNRTPEFDLHTILLGTGTPEDFAGTSRRAGHCLALAEAKVWRSRTPFVPTRHPKSYGDGSPKTDEKRDNLQIGSPKHDLLRLLEERGFPEPAAIRGPGDRGAPEATKLGGKAVRWLEFRTIRTRGGGRRADNRGYGFEIEFDEPVRGPICLGYGAHYGLGRFEPVG